MTSDQIEAIKNQVRANVGKDDPSLPIFLALVEAGAQAADDFHRIANALERIARQMPPGPVPS